MNEPTNSENDAEHNDLRALLHETAEAITPRGSLDDITERTRAARGPRHWLMPTLVAAAATALLVGGIGWALHAKDDGKAGPAATIASRQVPVYYVGRTAHGDKLFEEFHPAQVRTDNPVGTPFAAVAALLDDAPLDHDYTNPWAGLTDSIAVGNDGATGKDLQLNVTGALRDRPAGMTAEQARLAVQQLVQTALGSADKGAVLRILLDNSPADTLLGVSVGDQGVAVADQNALAPVQITSPANGAVLPAGTVTVSGVAATFEANVVWEIKSGDVVVKRGFTTAAECCTLSPYTFTVDLQPGTYTIVAHDTDESGAGGPVDSDTKEITVE